MKTVSHYSILHWFVLVLCYAMVMVDATYSIVATDPTTRQVGGAGATCIPNFDVFEALYVSVPNRAVLHTQGLLLPRDSPIIKTAKDEMMNMMSNENENEKSSNENDVKDILQMMRDLDTETLEVSSDDNFPTVTLRQYGIANFDSSAGYTGENLTPLFDVLGFTYDGVEQEQVDVGGTVRSSTSTTNNLVYHAQGNIVSTGTVNLLKTGFEEEVVSNDDNDEIQNGAELAARLMAAMRSVASSEGAGDMRCLYSDSGSSTSASGAYLHVDNPDGTVYVHLNIIGDGMTEPVDELQKAYDEWRMNMDMNLDGNISPSSASASHHRRFILRHSGGANFFSKLTEWIVTIFFAGIVMFFSF